MLLLHDGLVSEKRRENLLEKVMIAGRSGEFGK